MVSHPHLHLGGLLYKQLKGERRTFPADNKRLIECCTGDMIGRNSILGTKRPLQIDLSVLTCVRRNMSLCCQTGYVLKVKDLIEPMTAYFHMLAWSFPAILTIIIMAMNQIEASSVYGELGRITNKTCANHAAVVTRQTDLGCEGSGRLKKCFFIQKLAGSFNSIGSITFALVFV